MENENPNENGGGTPTTEPQTGEDIKLKAIEDFKEQIKKDEAEILRLNNENKSLLEKYINGNPGGSDAPQKEVKSEKEIIEMSKDLYNNSYDNITTAKKMLALRKAVLDRGGIDLFLPYGTNIAPTEEDIEKAGHVADVFQQSIDFAEGDNELFTNELQRRTIEVRPQVKKN